MADPAARHGDQLQRQAQLRRQAAALANSIASTEEEVARTYEEMAATRPPRDARRLRAEAKEAREFAAAERRQAACYERDEQDPGATDAHTASRPAQLPPSGAAGVAVVVADLASTRFCDSAGLQHLLLAHRQAVPARRGFRLARLERVTGTRQPGDSLAHAGIDMQLMIQTGQVS